MGTESVQQVPQVAFAKDHELVEALQPDGPHEPLRVWGAVGTVRRDGHALHAFGLEQGPPRLGIERVSVVDQVRGVAQEAIDRVQ